VEAEDRLDDILDKAEEYADTYRVLGRAHYIASDRCMALNRLLGIPVIIITATVGTTIFATFESGAGTTGKILLGLISLTGAVLASLQTALGFAETAQKHKAAGEAYRAIRRRFDLFQLRYSNAGPELRQPALDEMEGILADLAELPKEYPTIPDRCYNQALSEQRETGKA
jgi:hypothetical protein